MFESMVATMSVEKLPGAIFGLAVARFFASAIAQTDGHRVHHEQHTTIRLYCNQPSMNRNNRRWSAVETTVTTTRLDQHSRQDKKAFHFNHEALDIKYRTINNNYNSFHLIVVIIATSLSLHATISLQKQYLRARTIINNVFIYGKTYQDKTIWLDGAGRGGQDVTDG